MTEGNKFFEKVVPQVLKHHIDSSKLKHHIQKLCPMSIEPRKEIAFEIFSAFLEIKNSTTIKPTQKKKHENQMQKNCEIKKWYALGTIRL